MFCWILANRNLKNLNKNEGLETKERGWTFPPFLFVFSLPLLLLSSDLSSLLVLGVPNFTTNQHTGTYRAMRH
jgi:hypothetical protein